ncbi:MAG: hypothetical protein IPI37_02915 [Bacteroidales bacterium]|nr:hypothetical protein [Bacteroidales bacterium]
MLANSFGLPAIIFDEIDSGVSGEVASWWVLFWQRWAGACSDKHYASSAGGCQGRVHYHVYKEDGDHSTITRVRLLNDDERVMEVARLLSGSTVTDAAMRNARELMKDN